MIGIYSRPDLLFHQRKTRCLPLLSRECVPMHPEDRAGLREWVTAKIHWEEALQQAAIPACKTRVAGNSPGGNQYPYCLL